MLCGRGVWSGVTVVVVADALGDIGVERVAHACQAAGLMGAATSAQACRFCGLVSRLATIRGGAASVGNLAEVTLGASVLVRAGCGEGECGGARLVGSEKSPIVTLSAGCGAGMRRSDAAGTVRHLVAARALREASGSRCVRVAGQCRRSLWTSGMDCGPPRLSQSDSRLYAVKLTEPDSITILSAYDST